MMQTDISKNAASRILIIEDETLLSIELEILLEEMGHQVVGVASHVERALELIARHGPETDLAILDVKLGTSSARPVAQRLETLGIPYLVLTGARAVAEKIVGDRAPLLSKPVDFNVLRNTLSRLAPTQAA